MIKELLLLPVMVALDATKSFDLFLASTEKMAKATRRPNSGGAGGEGRLEAAILVP